MLQHYRTPSVNAQCRSMPIKIMASIQNASQCQSSALIGIDRHWDQCQNFYRHWSALGIDRGSPDINTFRKCFRILKKSTGISDTASYLLFVILWTKEHFWTDNSLFTLFSLLMICIILQYWAEICKLNEISGKIKECMKLSKPINQFHFDHVTKDLSQHVSFLVNDMPIGHHGFLTPVGVFFIM